jgi:hypothetical protein
VKKKVFEENKIISHFENFSTWESLVSAFAVFESLSRYKSSLG